MGLRESFKAWRRARILKAAIANGLSIPSQDRPKRSWLTRWIRGDYTLRNSELIFAAVSRIANSLSSMPVSLYKGAEKAKEPLGDLISFSPNPNMTSCQFFKTLDAPDGFDIIELGQVGISRGGMVDEASG